MNAEFTPDGLRRAMGDDPGPALAVQAVYTLEPDGRRVEGPFLADPEGASAGRTSVICVSPLPGGGTVRMIELNAADGVTIIRVHGPIILQDGDTVHIPIVFDY